MPPGTDPKIVHEAVRAAAELVAFGGKDELDLAQRIELFVAAMPSITDARTELRDRLQGAGQKISSAADRIADTLAKLSNTMSGREGIERKADAPAKGAGSAQERIDRARAG